jgi:hypothetical protein
MQYILTQEEYAALVPKKEKMRGFAARDAVVNALIGDRCIYSRREPGDRYCDDCPLAHIKGRHEVGPCGRPRKFSK